MNRIYCLINGEGEIIDKNEEKGIVTAKFKDENGKEFTAQYTIDGRLIVNGMPFKKRVLFETEPKIIVDGSLVDDAGKVIQDKDFIIFGNKKSFVFNAGFFDAKHFSLFTNDGYRNEIPKFRNLSPDMFMLKVENDELNKLKDKLKDETKTDIKKAEGPKEIELVKLEQSLEPPANETTKNIQKEAEQNKEQAEKEEFPVRVYGGKVIKVKGRGIRLESDTAIADASIEKKVTIEIEKKIGVGELATAVISFVPFNVYGALRNNNIQSLKKSVEVFDACLLITSGTKELQKNLSSENIVYDIDNGALMIDFK